MRRILIYWGTVTVSDGRAEGLLSRVRTGADEYARLEDLLDSDAIAGMDQNELAGLSRGLHDRVLDGTPGFEEALADLGNLLPELPTGTASALALGLLASMYLEVGTGNSRIPPRSPIADVLFGLTEEAFSEVPLQVIAKRLSANERQPLHIPLEPVIECHFDTEADGVESDTIRSLKIAGVETILPAQERQSLSLKQLVGSDAATGSEILKCAAGLFGLPADKFVSGGDEDSVFKIPDGVGFKDPKVAFRAKEKL